jgi:hypothetical protein
MDDADTMREEVQHLRHLATLTTDPRVLAEVEALIRELERRIRQSGS